MDLSPPHQKIALPLTHDPHCLPDIAACHSIGGDKLGLPALPKKVDLHRAVSKHMDMGWFMIVTEIMTRIPPSRGTVTIFEDNPS
jgi:hypothetical protein